MATPLTCPHCCQGLTSKNRVAAGRKIFCPACRRPFVARRTALGGSTAENAPRAAPQAPAPSARAHTEPRNARPALPRSRSRAEEEQPASPRGWNTAVGIAFGSFGLCLFVGVGLLLYGLSNTAGEPTPTEIVQLPPKKETPQAAPVAEKKEPAPEAPVIPEEPVAVAKPASPPPLATVAKPRPTLTPAVQQEIDGALNRGERFLKISQLRNGTWSGPGPHAVGYTAFPALTLLECGVSKEDDNIQAAAKAVRVGAARLNMTYDLGLAILFLDKLGDPKDKKLIQVLAMRLVAGQNYAGGWSYECNALSPQASQELLAFLQKERKYKLEHLVGKGELANPLRLTKADLGRPPLQGPGGQSENPGKADKPFEMTMDKGSAKGGEPAKAAKPPPIPGSVRLLPIFKPVDSGPRYKNLIMMGDNSNTQFALLALWVARRYDIPLERTFALAELRFRTTHNDDGGWSYWGPGVARFTTDSMTCVGLLGLAIGRGSEYELLHLDRTLQGAAVKKLTAQDEGIQKGLKRLGKALGEPQGRTTDLPMKPLYILWSVQRVAVLYNLKTIGDKDWYLWGAEILLANQRDNGCWEGLGFPGTGTINNTCFGLLFLKRANFSPDLSDSLRLYIPVVDPDRRGGSGSN